MGVNAPLAGLEFGSGLEAIVSLRGGAVFRLLEGGLGRLADTPGLPEMASFVHGNDMQACGEGEANPGNKGIREMQSGQVEVAVVAKVGADLILLITETGKGVGKWRCWARLDARRRFYAHSCRRLKRTHEPAADPSGLCWTTAPSALFMSADGGGAHGG